MDLLVFSSSPIGPRASWRLAVALEQAPGIGGPRWLEAWEAIESSELEFAVDDKERKKAKKRVRRWRDWVEPSDADPTEGLEGSEAVAICDRVIDWATARFAAGNDALFLSTSRLASDVRAALIAMQRARYPRALIERVIDQVLSDGADDPDAEAEAAPWQTVAHPGAIWAPSETVVWWNFCDSGERPARAPWTAAERAELSGLGCQPDDDARSARVLSAAWERAVIYARRQLILVSAGLDADGDEAAHALAHRIAPAVERVSVTTRLEDAIYTNHMSLGGTLLPRAAIEPLKLPASQATWATPAGFTDLLRDRHESASAFENLFECQLKWALQHVGRLRPGRARSIPDENRLMGNLAHALASGVFEAGDPPRPEDAASRSRAMLDAMIDQLAIPLRYPEHAVDLIHAQRRLPAAMAAIARTLSANGLTVVGTEQHFSATFDDGLSVLGTVDLVAEDAHGAPIIIDLKWTRTPKYREAELEEGTAVQLATYGALASPSHPPRGGYFLLKQGQFATLTTSELAGAPIDGARDLRETWEAVTQTWKMWRDQAATGVLHAIGVENVPVQPRTGTRLLRNVRCDRCHYATLCRMKGST
ncbi:MAG: PD-(D/E)XK nuclease family protein [Gemmatimonadaceae bacterium]|nr:PD-(D/E)XK nuclease family protein [Gemmatimonadaceae bacterium]